VAHTGANGAVPTVLIQDHFWARLLTNEGGGEYTFSEIMQDGDPRTGTAVELNGTDNLPAGAGDTGTAVRVFMTYTGSFYFGASSVEADVVGAEGIAVTVPAPGQWKVSVDLSSDPAFPGLEFDGSGESATLKAKVDDARGLAIDGDGIYVMIDDGEDGLLFDGGTIKVKVKADSGLDLDGDGLAVKPDGDAGIVVSADGVGVNVEADEGLEFEAGGGVGMAPPGPHAYTGKTLDCSLYLDKNGRVMGWYRPIASPPYLEWYSPWGHSEP